jgi:hypothetical protein
VCDQNSVLFGGKLQQDRILGASEAGILDIKDIDGGFARQQTRDDI